MFSAVAGKAIGVVWGLFKITPLGAVITHFGELKDAAGGAVQWIRDKVQELVDWIKNIPGAGLIKKGVGAIGSVLGFAEGGTVPGPVGAPMLALVHGGETVRPATVGPVTIHAKFNASARDIVDELDWQRKMSALN